MLNTQRPLLLTLGLFAVTFCVDSNADTLTDIPDNTWVKLDTSSEITTGILAFSGMAVDSTNRQLLVFGGGHNDYWGNEIWAFDIPTLQWTRMYEPDPKPNTLSSSSFKPKYPGAVFYPDTNEPLSEARPLTRHTYDTVEFLSAHGVMFSAGVFTWGSGQYSYCWKCDDTWTYDFKTNKWTYRTNQNVPATEGSAAAYDPVSDTLFLMSRSETWKYDLNSDAWTEINTNGIPTLGIETVAEYDSQRQCVYYFGGEYPSSNELWKYDIAENSWTKLSPSGPAPAAGGGYGMAYDSVNDALLVYKDGGIWAYEPTPNTWKRMSPALSPPQSGRVHGNFKYDAASNAAFLVTRNNNFNLETWAYRFQGGGTPIVAPEEITDLKAD